MNKAEHMYNCLPERAGEPASEGMMREYLLARTLSSLARRKAAFETLVADGTPEELAEYQAGMRAAYLESLGNFKGFPDRATPLNATVTGTLEKTGYKVERILFEPQPKHYATALFFSPRGERYEGKRLPVVLLFSGHDLDAKGCEIYQRGAALAAINGLAVFAVDPIEQGERLQFRFDEWGTGAHIALGMGSILVGRNLASYMIWDNMRAIDYLLSRPDVDPERIGAMGNSGGGTQTIELLPIDPRVKCAAPSCHVCSLERVYSSTAGPGDSEQHFFGEAAFGKDHVEHLVMRAPTPVLVNADLKDFFPIEGARDTVAQARAFFARLGAKDRIDMVETDAGHGWHQPLREASVAWMVRWLCGEERATPEPEDLEVLTAEEYRVTPTGFVRDLPGYVSIYDLNTSYDQETLAPQRKRIWAGDRETALESVRNLAGIRHLAKLPPPEVTEHETLDHDDHEITKLALVPEEGITLPGLLYRPAKDAKPTGATLYLNTEGKASDPMRLAELVRGGRIVLALDLRGIGETRADENTYKGQDFAQPYGEICLAYVMGRSFVGMRTEDILVAARWLAEREKQNGIEPVSLLAVGSDVGIPALHAAALERALFGEVTVDGVMDSWAGALGKPMPGLGVNVVHAALTAYDLPDLRAALA